MGRRSWGIDRFAPLLVAATVAACNGSGANDDPEPANPTDPPGDAPACLGDQPLIADRAALAAATFEARGLGLVGEPALEALLEREAAILIDLGVLRESCTLALQEDLASRIPVLTTDVKAWTASAPLGFVSPPPTFVLANNSVSYRARLSTAPAGFVFALAQAPSGAVIDSAAGVVTWQPTLADKGKHVFAVEATGASATARQIFTLTVAERRVLFVGSITDAPVTMTVGATSTPLDGTVVRVPAGAITGTDELSLSMIDPAPPSGSDIRIVGPALELSLASGRRHMDKPFEIELPPPSLSPGEHAGMFAWSPPGGPSMIHPANGSWGAVAMAGPAGVVPTVGTTAAGATTSTPVDVRLGGYHFWGPASTGIATLDALKAALQGAHAEIVGIDGYLDPTTDGTVQISVVDLESRCGAQVPDRFTIHVDRTISECGTPWIRHVMAHELFHVIQFHTPEKRKRGELQFRGGAQWWMEATAEFAGQKFMKAAAKNRLADAGSIVRATLTSLPSESALKDDDRDQAYDAFIFFDYLTKKHGFDMRSFWENVVPSQLMVDGAAGQVLFDAQGSGAIPYMPFVQAYRRGRTSANFNLLGAAIEAPDALTPIDLPANGDVLSLTDNHDLAHLSSRTYALKVPADSPVRRCSPRSPATRRSRGSTTVTRRRRSPSSPTRPTSRTSASSRARRSSSTSATSSTPRRATVRSGSRSGWPPRAARWPVRSCTRAS